MRMKLVARWSGALVLSLVVLTFALGLLAAPREDASAAPRTGVSPDEKATILGNHNEWRARYNSPAVVWDDNLAALADAWATQMANTGQFEHRPNNKYGENLWTGSAGGFPISDVTNNWGNEVNDYNLANNSCNPEAVCGHFTQIVWWSTTRIGCGKATGNGSDYVVCNYDPPGNFGDQSPFGPR